MKAKDAVLYFTDSDTGDKIKLEFPYVNIDIRKEHEEFDTVYKTEGFDLAFNEFRMSKTPKVKHVVHSNNVCTVIWDDGVKTQSACHPEDTYNKDVGLLVAYMKRFMPTEQIIELLEKWSHQQQKQEDINARKKADKARKQVKAELDEAREMYEQMNKRFKENTVLFKDKADLFGHRPNTEKEEDSEPTLADVLDAMVDGFIGFEKYCEDIKKSMNEALKESDWEEDTLFGFPIKYRIKKG